PSGRSSNGATSVLACLLSLHDALPISRSRAAGGCRAAPPRSAAPPGRAAGARRSAAQPAGRARPRPPCGPARGGAASAGPATARSEEHTSELQSRENLVCRLLLEKKKH